MEETKTPKAVIAFCAVIGAASTFVFVQYLFQFSFFGNGTLALDGRELGSAAIVLCAFPLFGWLGSRMWRAEWALPILLGLSGSAAVFLFFTTALLGGAGTSAPVLLVAAVALFAASSLPWFTLRRMIKGRAGRSDGRGHIEFLDGGHGRTELRHLGDVVAWQDRSAAPTGYRVDGDARRYRAVAGTRELLVSRARKRAAFLVLVGLAFASVFIAYQSITYFRWAYVYPGLSG